MVACKWVLFVHHLSWRGFCRKFLPHPTFSCIWIAYNVWMKYGEISLTYYFPRNKALINGWALAYIISEWYQCSYIKHIILIYTVHVYNSSQMLLLAWYNSCGSYRHEPNEIIYVIIYYSGKWLYKYVNACRLGSNCLIGPRSWPQLRERQCNKQLYFTRCVTFEINISCKKTYFLYNIIWMLSCIRYETSLWLSRSTVPQTDQIYSNNWQTNE